MVRWRPCGDDPFEPRDLSGHVGALASPGLDEHIRLHRHVASSVLRERAARESVLRTPGSQRGHDVRLGAPDPGDALDGGEDRFRQRPVVGSLHEGEDVGLPPAQVRLCHALHPRTAATTSSFLPGSTVMRTYAETAMAHPGRCALHPSSRRRRPVEKAWNPSADKADEAMRHAARAEHALRSAPWFWALPCSGEPTVPKEE